MTRTAVPAWGNGAVSGKRLVEKRLPLAFRKLPKADEVLAAKQRGHRKGIAAVTGGTSVVATAYAAGNRHGKRSEVGIAKNIPTSAMQLLRPDSAKSAAASETKSMQPKKPKTPGKVEKALGDHQAQAHGKASEYYGRARKERINARRIAGQKLDPFAGRHQYEAQRESYKRAMGSSHMFKTSADMWRKTAPVRLVVKSDVEKRERYYDPEARRQRRAGAAEGSLGTGALAAGIASRPHIGATQHGMMQFGAKKGRLGLAAALGGGALVIRRQNNSAANRGWR